MLLSLSKVNISGLTLDIFLGGLTTGGGSGSGGGDGGGGGSIAGGMG